MLQVLGTITLEPSFHGSHRWQLYLADQGDSSIEAEHVCSGLVRVAVDARTLEEFVPTGDAIIAASRASLVGCDGMTISFDLVVNGVPVRAAIWGVRPKTHGALWELADGLWRLLYREGPARYRPYLEHLDRYFRRELPLIWISPNHARLYGSLSSDDSVALAEALQRLPSCGTVDMSNFGGMGTLLYPLFRLADQRTNARWIVNEAARRALLAAGVGPERLAETTEGPYRTGRRFELVVTDVDAPVRVSVEVAALLQLSTRDALARLKTLPLSLGRFDEEDVQPLVARLLAAGSRVQVR